MKTFKDVILGDQLVLVDFFATWCQPCKMMHPILEQVKAVLGDRIRIIKVDVDKYGVTAKEYGIQSVPTLMLFRNGEVLWRTSGVVQKAGPKIHSVRPAVDVLFGSVVKVLGADVLGVLLTGMGKDGADGLLRLRQAGAPTIGQDRETCVVYGMPRIAQERSALLYQLPLPQIGPAIQKIAGARY